MTALPPGPPAPPVAPPPPPAEPPQPPPLAPPGPVAPPAGVYASQMPQPASLGAYGAPAPYAVYSVPAVRRQRTGLIVVAQILMVCKGILWLLAGAAILAAGVYLVIHGGDLRSLPGYRNYPGLDATATGLIGLAAGVVIALALTLIAIGVADIALGVAIGRPSNVARWLTVAVVVVAGLIALSGLIAQLNHTPTLSGLVAEAAWLGTNVFVFCALVIDPRSRQSFG